MYCQPDLCKAGQIAMIVSVHQPQYIPWLGYFDKIAKSDVFVYLDCVQYKEREFQNRNKIRTDRGWMWLTVPVVTEGKGRQIISDVLIDQTDDWRQRHWKSLVSWYHAAPYGAAHLPFFEDTYKREWVKLVDINVHITSYLLEIFAIPTTIVFESSLQVTSTRTDRIIDICSKLKADTYLSGSGGKEYLEEEKFSAQGITLSYQEYKHPVYKQRFTASENEFISYMSVLDLVFNEGAKSRDILTGNA